MKKYFLGGIVTALCGVPAWADDGEFADVPTIVVTADPRVDRTADDIIQPVSVLRGDELARRQAATLGQVLDGLPGVANSSFGPGVGRPVIRGLQGSRVQVLEDGLRTADVSGEGADHSIAIDPSRADQIEVLRGPATLLYGSGAAGGVVNVRTERFYPDSGDGVGVHGVLTYGENGSDRHGHAGLEVPLDERFVFRADGSLRRSGDFSIDGFQQVDQEAGNRNRLRNSSIETDSYSATGLFRSDWGHVGLGLSTWETDYGIPENFDARPLDLGGQEDEFERVLAEYDRIDLHGELRDPWPGVRALRLKMAYTEFTQQEVGFEFERTPEGGELEEREVEAEFSNDQFEGRVELVHAPLWNWSGAIGLHYRDRDFFADAPEEEDEFFYVRPNRMRSVGVFLLEERPTGFGRIEFGARVEHERARPGDVIGSAVEGITLADGGFLALPESLASRSFRPLSLSFGALVDLDDVHHLRSSITRAQRAPSPEQLYAFGRHAAAGTFEVGDPGMGKESYLNLELGIDRHHGALRYDFAVFYNRVDDYIFLLAEDDGTGTPVFVNDLGNRAGEGAAADCEPDAGGLCRLRNQLVFNTQADAGFYGAEFSAIADLLEGPVPLSVRLSADHVRGKLRDGGNLPRITPTRVGLGLDTSWRNFDFSLDYQRVFRQSRVGETEDRTDGFDLLSFDLLWRPNALQYLEFVLQGRNLLNEAGRLHQSFFKDDAPIVGRALFGGVRFDFGG